MRPALALAVLFAAACLSPSPDGALVATASKDSTLRVWDVATGLCAAICEGHIERLCALVEEIGSQQLAPQERLRLLVQRFVEEYADAQNAHRVLTEDVRFLNQVDQQRILDGERKVVEAMAQAMIAVRPELDASKMAKPLTMLLFGMINWMFMWLKPDGALTHARMAAVVSDLLFGGIDAVRLDPIDSDQGSRDSSKDESKDGSKDGSKLSNKVSNKVSSKAGK